jgi:hypothetical protein
MKTRKQLLDAAEAALKAAVQRYHRAYAAGVHGDGLADLMEDRCRAEDDVREAKRLVQEDCEAEQAFRSALVLYNRAMTAAALGWAKAGYTEAGKWAARHVAV